MDPLEALKLVKHGDLQLSLPVAEGPLGRSSLRAGPNTVIHLTVRVRDGVLDLQHARATIDPPLKGPLSLSKVAEIKISPGGQLTAEASFFPDFRIERPIPPKLSELATWLQGDAEKKLPVTLMGLNVGTVDLAEMAPATTSEAAGPPLARSLLGDQARISLQGVEFNEGKLSLGSAGELLLGSGSKVDIEGGQRELGLRGHVNIARLNLDSGGTRLRGLDGSADLEVTFRRPEQGPVSASTSVRNLKLRTEYAVTERANGDFLSLASGSISNGSIELRPTLAKLNIERFEGTVTGGKLTIPDADGTAEVRLERSVISGDLQIDPNRILLRGRVDLKARVEDYQGGARGATFDLKRVDVRGRGEVVLDSEKGLRVQGGPFEVETRLNRATLPGGTVATGSVNLRAKSLSVTNDGGFSAQGSGQVDLALEGVNLSDQGVSLRGSATVRGGAELELGEQGVKLTGGNLELDAAVSEGRVQLGQGIDLELKAGTRVRTELVEAAFGPGDATARFREGTEISAQIEKGRFTVPGGPGYDLRAGELVFRLDQLSYDPGGLPSAKGSMHLDAVIAEDPAAPSGPSGVAVQQMEGFERRLEVDLGRFSIARDGSFDVEEINFAVQVRVQRFRGKISR